MSWEEFLDLDLDDIIDKCIRVPLTDCPSEALSLLAVLESETQPEKIRRNAAYAIEALPPEWGDLRRWPHNEATEIVDRLERVLSSVITRDVEAACKQAIRAIRHHSIDK